MTASPGWYPAPGGQAGMLRYWDGQRWSAALSPTSAAPPPGVSRPLIASQASAANSPPRSQRRRWWPWIVAGAFVVALVTVLAFALTRPAPNRITEFPSEPTAEPCPSRRTPTEPTSGQQGDPQRVVGGPLSYPMLSAPWGKVDRTETRLPFGRDVAKQEVTVETDAAGRRTWLAAILVAELTAGDGFFSPQEGSEIVVRCVLGAFYDDAVIKRADVRNEATTVDGREAWVVESNLSFDIPGIKAKGELLIVVIVAVDDARSGVFYASIPDTVPELFDDARTATRDLKVVS